MALRTREASRSPMTPNVSPNPGLRQRAQRRVAGDPLHQRQLRRTVWDKGPPPAAFDPALLTQAKLAVAEAALELGSGSPPWKAFARSLPIYTHHDSASALAWAAGRARAKTAGPFVDHRGFEFWVDSYEPVSYLQVFRAHGGPPFLMVPAESDAPGAQRSEPADAGRFPPTRPAARPVECRSPTRAAARARQHRAHIHRPSRLTHRVWLRRGASPHTHA